MRLPKICVVILSLLMAIPLFASQESVRAEYELTDLDVKIVWFDSVAKLRRGLKPYCQTCRRVLAYSFFNDEGRCIIFTVRPKRVDDDATISLGHEMLHCVAGDYHK